MPRALLHIACWACALAFAACALWADARMLRDAKPRSAAVDMPHDYATLENNRFSLLRDHLPFVGTVGYIAKKTGDIAVDNRHYIMAQYALAPLIIVDSPDVHIVIGNFQTEADLQAAIREAAARGTHFRMTADGHFIAGLAVLENMEKPASQPVEESDP